MGVEHVGIVTWGGGVIVASEEGGVTLQLQHQPHM